MAVSKTIANLAVAITARTSGLNKGLARAQKQLAAFTRTSAIFAAAGAGLVTAAITAGTKRSLEAIDAQAKLADSTGVLLDRFGGLAHGAELAGVSQESLGRAFGLLGKNVVDAARGTGEAVDAFRMLRLDATRLVQLSPEEQFRAITQAMEGVQNASERINIVRAIFGRGGTELLNLIKSGTRGLDEMQAEAERLGLAINRVDAAKIEEANDNMTRAGRVIEGLFNQIAIQVAPVISELAQGFIAWATAGEGASARIRDAINNQVLPIVGSLVNAWGSVKGSIDLASGAALQFAATTIKVASFSPAGLLARGVEKIADLVTGDTESSIDRLVANLEGAADELFRSGTEKINTDFTPRLVDLFNQIQAEATKRATGAPQAPSQQPATERLRTGTFELTSTAQIFARSLSQISDPTVKAVNRSNELLRQIARNTAGGGNVARAT